MGAEREWSERGRARAGHRAEQGLSERRAERGRGEWSAKWGWSEGGQAARVGKQ